MQRCCSKSDSMDRTEDRRWLGKALIALGASAFWLGAAVYVTGTIATGAVIGGPLLILSVVAIERVRLQVPGLHRNASQVSIGFPGSTSKHVQSQTTVTSNRIGPDRQEFTVVVLTVNNYRERTIRNPHWNYVFPRGYEITSFNGIAPSRPVLADRDGAVRVKTNHPDELPSLSFPAGMGIEAKLGVMAPAGTRGFQMGVVLTQDDGPMVRKFLSVELVRPWIRSEKVID